MGDIPRPAGLTDKAGRLWDSVLREGTWDAGRLVLLEIALRYLDRAEEARQTVEREGMTSRTATTGVLHAHPLLRVEADAQERFMAAWTSLGLSEPPASRHPKKAAEILSPEDIDRLVSR